MTTASGIVACFIYSHLNYIIISKVRASLAFFGFCFVSLINSSAQIVTLRVSAKRRETNFQTLLKRKIKLCDN